MSEMAEQIVGDVLCNIMLDMLSGPEAVLGLTEASSLYTSMEVQESEDRLTPSSSVGCDCGFEQR